MGSGRQVFMTVMAEAKHIKIELTVPPKSLAAKNPRLFYTVTRATELAVVPMTGALAEHSRKYLPRHSLKLFYPAAGADISAVYVALELIEMDSIDSADLYFADMASMNTASLLKEVEKIRPFVDDCRVEDAGGSLHISFSYKGRQVNIFYYIGIDKDILAGLPRDLNLLYFHAHGSEGGMAHSAIPPIWKAFIRHCDGPIAVFSHRYPGTLLDLISDWCAYIPLQFDRWQTVIPRYEGGAAFGLDGPVDLQLIKNAWGGLESDEDLRVGSYVPYEDTDKLVVFKALNKLKDPIPGLDETTRADLTKFFKMQEFPIEGGQSIANDAASGRDFKGLRDSDPGLCFDITHHATAAILRGLSIDLSKPTEERLRQIEDKLKSPLIELDNIERLFLIKTLWYAGREVEPAILLDLVEDLNSDDELRTADITISQSRRFFDPKPILRKAAVRIENIYDSRLIDRYLWFLIRFEDKDIKAALTEYPAAKDKLFGLCLDRAYKVAEKSGLTKEGFLRCADTALLLHIIDSDRTLNFVSSPDSEKKLLKHADPELIERIFLPVMRLFDDKEGLTEDQRRLIDSIYEEYQWPKKIRKRKLDRHRNHTANTRLCAYLEQGLGEQYRQIIEAMRANPRHLFLPTYALPWAYLDKPLPTQNGQTISQPMVVAWMTKELNLKPGYRVVEIGTGSGWQTSVLSHLVGKKGHVYTIEYDGRLAEMGEGNFNRMGITNVTVYKARDGGLGLAEEAPFDAILITAGVPAQEEKSNRLIEETLKPQIKEGGRIIFPIITKEDGSDGYIMAAKREKGEMRYRRLQRIVFTPLSGIFGCGPAADQGKKRQSAEPPTFKAGAGGAIIGEKTSLSAIASAA